MGTNYSHSHANGFTSEGAVVEDKLYDNFSVRRKYTALMGQGVQLRGTGMGKISIGAVTSAVKASGANTGNGTCVIDVTAPRQKGAQAGTYTLRCITAAANGGRFELKDPFGRSLGLYDLPGTSGGSLTITNQVKLALTDGSTDFVVGDGFDITVADGSGKWVKSVAAAVDGSQVIRGILIHDIDTTASDVDAILGRIGSCNGDAVIFGAGHTLASTFDACLDRGIIFDKVIG